MRRPNRCPSIVPQANQDTYLVLDDFGGRLGRAWRETDEEATDRETLIRDLMNDQYGNPARIVAFNQYRPGLVSRRDHRYHRRATQALCGVRRSASLGAGVPGDRRVAPFRISIPIAYLSHMRKQTRERGP